MMRFDNPCEKSKNVCPDKLQPIGKKFDLWNSTLQSDCIPGASLTVDEQLLTVRGSCSFRQYIPSKPGKYGVKFSLICHSHTGYPLKLDIYKGKELNEQITSSLGNIFVLNLSDAHKNSGRNITCDKFFTSEQLGQKKVAEKSDISYNNKKNRTEFPTTFTVA